MSGRRVQVDTRTVSNVHLGMLDACSRHDSALNSLLQRGGHAARGRTSVAFASVILDSADCSVVVRIET